jgi:hypothetical protein
LRSAADSPLPRVREAPAAGSACRSMGARRLQPRAPSLPLRLIRGRFEPPRTAASRRWRSRGSSRSTSGPHSLSTFCRSRAPRHGARGRIPISPATTRAGTSASPGTVTARLRRRGRSPRTRSSRFTRCSPGDSRFSPGSPLCGP